jgi:hypothetical protein
MENLKRGISDGINGMSDRVKKSLRDAGRYATGRTESKIKTVTRESEKGYISVLSGPKHIAALQDGRKATPPGAPSSNGAFLQSLKEWMRAKGLEGNVYALLNHIHKVGYRGTPGVIRDSIQPATAKELIKAGARVDVRSIIYQALK